MTSSARSGGFAAPAVDSDATFGNVERYDDLNRRQFLCELAEEARVELALRKAALPMMI